MFHNTRSSRFTYRRETLPSTAGHIIALAGELGIHIAAPSYSRDDPALGGALRFERIRTASGEREIRVSYVAQSLTQLRELAPLSLSSPPFQEQLLTFKEE